MLKKTLMVMLMLALLLYVFTALEVRAERATLKETELVCQNWLSYMVYQRGAWAEETQPQIVDVDEIVKGDTVLARCFSIAPRGFVVVPILKELPPIKAYSAEYRLDVNERGGFAQLLREVLLDRIRRYTKIYGSLDAVQPLTGDVLLGRGHKAQWKRFLKSEKEFKTDLREGKFQPLTEAGPLLTTSWHQYPPYNNFCPMGDEDCDICPNGKPPTLPTKVGCVATATAQIMKYWNWPRSGTGSHSYWWSGDQSCGGTTPTEYLTATFSDPYDWEYMPDHCESGCSLAEQEALAELCYEVGVAYAMDYGVCGSGTWTSLAVTVFPTYFRYDSSINQQDRDDYIPAEWFSIIQTEINNGRPIQYRIYRHSIVCDGWRNTGGLNQYHMNYGWGGAFTTWYSIDSLYCYWVTQDSLCPPMEEYLIRNIMPATGSEIVVKPDSTGDFPTIQAAINAASFGDIILLTNGTFAGDGNRDIDFLGKPITVRSQSGNPDLCVIDCQGSFEDPHRGFYFHSGEGSGSVIEGVTITNGYVYVYPEGGGGVFCNSNSSPTLRNCLFSNNSAVLYGGGMACNNQSHPTLDKCTFSGNSAGVGKFHDLVDFTSSVNFAGPDTEMAFGGGMFCDSLSHPSLTNCIFTGNFSGGYAGGISCNAGASPTLTNCIFTANSASFHGGGLSCCSDLSHPTLTNCIFSRNSANSYGGGMGVTGGQPTLINCTFSQNSAPVGGGGVYCMPGGSAMLENTIIAFSTQGEAVGCNNGSVLLTCCDVYGNAGGDWVGGIANQYGINGNFSEDPLFCDPDNGDYHLLDESPCAPEQQPECGLIGALGVGCDQAPPITMPITETGVDLPFVYGPDTLAILNFVSEELKYVIIEAEKGTLPPDLPEGTNWVHRYYSITPISEGASFEATMTLFYSQSEFDVSGLSDESQLGLCRYDDSESTWTFEGGIVDTEENSITLSGVTEFSIWGITDSSNTYPMIRGDANRDGQINISDIVYLTNYLFVNGPKPDPLWVGDANCDGGVDITDVVYLINYLFAGGPPPGCE